MASEKKEFRSLAELHGWQQNPRDITPAAFARLKHELKSLGQFKPLIITADGTVLGGNMRLRAFAELGVKDVWVSVVDAPTDADKLRFALADNDSAGFYVEHLLTEQIQKLPEEEWGDFSVQTSPGVSLQQIAEMLAKTDRGLDVNTTGDDLKTYLTNSVKQIVLYFTLEEYEALLPRLERVMQDFGVENHTAALMHILKFYEDARPEA